MGKGELEEFYRRFRGVVSEFARGLQLTQRDEIVCHGVTLTQCAVIDEVRRAGRLTMNQLSDRLSLARSTMTRVVDTLVRKGILERVRDDEDRRVVEVQLTAEGEDLSRRLEDCLRGFYMSVLQHIPAEKREEVLDSLRLLLNAIRKGGGSCC